MRVDRKAGGRCIVQVNKSSVSGEPHASSSSPPSFSSSSKENTVGDCVQTPHPPSPPRPVPCVTCKSNGRIDGVDGSSAPFECSRPGSGDIVEGVEREPKSPQIRHCRTDLGKLRATGTPRPGHKQTRGMRLAPVWEIEGPGLPSRAISSLLVPLAPKMGMGISPCTMFVPRRCFAWMHETLSYLGSPGTKAFRGLASVSTR